MQTLSKVVAALAECGVNFEVFTHTEGRNGTTPYHWDGELTAYVRSYETPLGFEKKHIAEALAGGTIHHKGKRGPYWEWLCMVEG